MRKTAAFIPVLILTLLCSCGGERGAEERALDMRAGILPARSVEFEVAIRADYGDAVFDFAAQYEGSSADGILTVTEPEEIAGLRARVSVSEASVLYDGVELATGDLTGDGLSPAEALPVIMEQWKTGYLESCTYEKLGEADTVLIKSHVTDDIYHASWFDRETLTPLRSELSLNGRMIIACEFRSAAIE